MRHGSCLHQPNMFLRFLFTTGLVCAALSLFLGGCTNQPSTRTLNDKAARSSGSISQPNGIAWPAGMRRLAMLPIYSSRPIDATQRDMDGIFRAQLARVVKYEIVEVSREEMLSLIDQEAVSSTDPIPASVIAALKSKYAADAVLFTDFTVFRPYKPLAIGVRAKIVNLKNMDVIWMADGILDAAEPDVADMASMFADTGLQMRYVSPTIQKGQEREKNSGNQVLLQSPRLYAGFVAHETFASLAPPPPEPATNR